MAALRLLHTADMHLDWLFESMPITRKRKRREELEKGLLCIADLARAHGADALLISGDLFHSQTASDRIVAVVKRELQALASSGIDVVLLPGNHDPATFRAYVGELRGEGIYVFRDDRWQCVHLRCGLEVWGRAWCATDDGRILLPELEAAIAAYGPGDGLRVVMHHGQVAASPAGMQGSYRPFTPSQLGCLGADYVALGHVHKSGDVRIPGSDTIARYPGTPFRLSFSEASPRSVSLVSLTRGERADVSELEVPDRPYSTISLSLSSRTVDEAVDAVCALADGEMCLQVTLTGVVLDEEASPRDAILNAAGDMFFHLEIVDRTESLTLREVGAVEGTVRGAFVRAIGARLASPDLAARDRRVLEAALRFGLAALRGGVGA